MYDILGVKATGYQDDHITEVTGHGADPSDITLIVLQNQTGQ